MRGLLNLQWPEVDNGEGGGAICVDVSKAKLGPTGWEEWRKRRRDDYRGQRVGQTQSGRRDKTEGESYRTKRALITLSVLRVILDAPAANRLCGRTRYFISETKVRLSGATFGSKWGRRGGGGGGGVK